MSPKLIKILGAIKSEARIVGLFVFKLSMWTYMFFGGINLLIVSVMHNFGPSFIFCANVFLGIFFAKTYAVYLLRKEQLNALSRDLERIRREAESANRQVLILGVQLEAEKKYLQNQIDNLGAALIEANEKYYFDKGELLFHP